MKVIGRTVLAALAVVFLVPVVALAQGFDTAGSTVSWLVEQGPAVVAVVVGIGSSQFLKLAKYLPKEFSGPVQHLGMVAASTLVPAALAYLATILGPWAEVLDSTGLWAVVTAAVGTTFVTYIIEKFPSNK